MIELLILYVLSAAPNTMYGVLKSILKNFSPYTKPSFGTVKPALLRLEENGSIISRESFSEGGKMSVLYSLTPDGLKHLREKILDSKSQNPVNFLSNARIQVACAGFLDKTDQAELFKQLRQKSETIKTDAESKISDNIISPTYFHRLVLDNTICEYKNFITLLEGLEHACDS